MSRKQLMQSMDFFSVENMMYSSSWRPTVQTQSTSAAAEVVVAQKDYIRFHIFLLIP